jgi:hypothetical protein
MTDNRSNRKTRMLPFVSLLDKDRQANLLALIGKAKKLEIEGFEKVAWNESVWRINAGRLTKITGKNTSNASLIFHFPPKLGNAPLNGQWADLIKALVLLRYHRRNQHITNQRIFITAASYIAHEAIKNNYQIFQLTPELFDSACQLITKHYSDIAAYNLQKTIGEIAAHLDANCLCNIYFNYRYSRLKRPISTNGIGYKRLDDPEILTTKSNKLISSEVFRTLGKLYQNVPKNHKYRFYILILTLLACLGRRFSEVALLPNQEVTYDEEGKAFIEYFPKKISQGDVFSPRRRLYLPTAATTIITDILHELSEHCSPARKTAAAMQKSANADLTFLSNIPENKRLYADDLNSLGLSHTLLYTTGWLRNNGYTTADPDKLTVNNNKPPYSLHYTTKAGVIKYCQRDFFPHLIQPIHIDQNGKQYYLKDLLLVRHRGLSSGAYSHWIATQCTHSMMTTFLRYFGDLANQYTSSSINANFTSHHFRHTLNTLLDEGGLTDLLQTEWFGRKNPRDTKAYQHTSREKRALMLREDIKNGRVGGQIIEKLKSIPISVQDAFLKARVNAVHDVGSGICVHNFVQTPCERHLQCSADCKDYVWVKDDKGRADDLKRQYSMTVVARETAEKKSKEKNAKRSIDWLTHNDKKLVILSKQLADNDISEFDPYKYLEAPSNE